MSKTWARVPLGDVLTHRKEFINIDDTTTYSRPRVRLHAQGIVLRDQIPGALIKTKKQQVCKAREFLVAEIDAKVGGFGIVPDSLSGSICSSHYFLFGIDDAKLDHRYIGYFIKTPAFREQVEAQGSTNYAAIRAGDVLRYWLPLPPLAEQRRLVAAIEELAGPIGDAHALRRQAMKEVDALLLSSASSLRFTPATPMLALGDIIGVESLRNGKSVKSADSADSIRCLTLSSMRGGRIDIKIAKPVPLTSVEAEPYLVRRNDVFIVRGNGSKELCGLAGRIDQDAPGIIFPDLFIKVPIPSDRLLPEFFVRVWNSTATREVIEEKAKTTSGIWKVNQGHISSTLVPVPPLPEQRRIIAELDALQARVDALKRLQSETAAELDALLPAILDRAFKGDLI